LNGSTLTVNDQLVIGSSGTLKLWGSEVLTATTKVLNSSCTVMFTGNNDVNVDTFTLTRFATSYQNLIFQSTGTALDVFLSTGNLTINDDLNVASGTLSLNGFNVTANTSRTTFNNTGTVRLIGSETISNLTNDVDSGTWTYVGDGDSAVDTFTMKDFGIGDDYYNLVINMTDANDAIQSNNDMAVVNYFTINRGTYSARPGGFCWWNNNSGRR
jgi:hypothetical protein